MNTRHIWFRTILTVSVVLLVGCSGGGNNGNVNQPDNTSPVITLTGDNPQVIAVGEAYAELGATASDNRDGDLTASIVINASAIDSSVPGTYQVTYSVSDAAGNAATTVIRNVTYEDRTPPVISLVGDDPLVLPMGSVYIDPGATASDNVNGDLSASITIDASGVDTSTPGDYLVTYNVTDAAGNAATTVTRTVTVELTVPAEPTVSVSGDIKTLNFSWSEPGYVDYYRLLENADGHSGFTQVGDDIPAGTLTAKRDIAVHLFDWVNAQYIVEACNVVGCSSSAVATATDVMLDTIGYIKLPSTIPGARLGTVVTVSKDGSTLAVGASGNNTVLIFRRKSGAWASEAGLQGSNTEDGDDFGSALALSADGNVLAVGATLEDSDATGINGDGSNNLAEDSGAVYVFSFDGADWNQDAYIKSSNSEAGDVFGTSLDISNDGGALVVGAIGEDSNFSSDPADNSASMSGAAYGYVDLGMGWQQTAYMKGEFSGKNDHYGKSVAIEGEGSLAVVGAPGAGNRAAGRVYTWFGGPRGWEQTGAVLPDVGASNAEEFDNFGISIAISDDDRWGILAVGATGEASNSTGIDGDPVDNSAPEAGAVYLYRLFIDDPGHAYWVQSAYVKAPNAAALDQFGRSIALNADGTLLAVGAIAEDSDAIGVGGNPVSGLSANSGATYVYQFIDDNWSFRRYVKASNTGPDDSFGYSVSLSGDGTTLAVGAPFEDSGAVGVGGDQNDNSARDAGAVYVY